VFEYFLFKIKITQSMLTKKWHELSINEINNMEEKIKKIRIYIKNDFILRKKISKHVNIEINDDLYNYIHSCLKIIS